MAPGADYAHRFTEPGTYRYFCIPHEAAGTVGTVVVKPRD
ncbi:plastocyanin/azurin family copper-binding protein [Salinisphaera orenii]